MLKLKRFKNNMANTQMKKGAICKKTPLIQWGS